MLSLKLERRSPIRIVATLAMALGSLGWVSSANTAESEELIGRKIDGFDIQDFRGKEYTLDSFADRQLLVFYFTGTECPLVALYNQRIQQMSEEFADRGVAFIGVNSNAQDSITEIAAQVNRFGLTFPVLKDVGHRLADLFGATRTPEVFVLDEQRKVRYCGRIDGQFTFGSGVGLAQPVAKRDDLRIALAELLDQKSVSVPTTEVKGCLIGRVRRENSDSEVTYSNQIARLFQEHCLECHRDGQIAPFALTEYDEAAGWGEMIAEVVREQRMPPWHANPEIGHFSNDNRLSDDEKQLIERWVAAGCPEGNPAQLPAPRTYREGWFMDEEPDQVIWMHPEPVGVKAAGVEDYRHYVVDPGFTEDKWVRLAECLPGNRAVVHHIIVYIKSPDALDSNIGEHELLVGFAPGTRPFVAPEGWARRIPAGSKLIFEMYYTPIGTPQTDRSRLGLKFMDEKDVTHHLWTTNAINTRLDIPPHDPAHEVTARSTFRRDVQLLSMFPHMHMRGKSFRYELVYPDGRQEVLLDVPRYDFNWQTSFVLAEPKSIPKGTEMICTAVFDNSEDNLANPDPTKRVNWGQQTWDEMMIGWHDVAMLRDAKSSQESTDQ